MAADLLWALPLGLAGGLLAFRGFGARGGSLARGGAVAAMLALVLAAGFTPAFDGYRSDLWVYLTVVERVAAGDWLLHREPFWLEPPGGPHHSLNWLLLGLVTRATGVEPRLLVLGLRLVSLALLAGAAWHLAGRAFDDRRARLLAVVLFFGAIPQLWTEIGLNRTFSLAYVLFATSWALGMRGTPRAGRDAAVLAAALALAFLTHFFGGLLALGGVGLAASARALRTPWEGPPPWGPLALGGVAGVALASPWIALYLGKGDLEIAEAYLLGPGQVRALGLRWLHPAQLLREISPPVWALLATGLAWGAARRHMAPAARTLCALGAAAVALALLTPLYHLWSERLGGWLALRLLALAFAWIPAAAALRALLAGRRSARAAAALLLVAVYGLGAARVVRDLRKEHLYFELAPAARAEARVLRPLLRDRVYLSEADLAYGLAAPTLGHPLPVPTGRASPFHDFPARERAVRAALRENSPACWARLLARHPRVELLVLPASGEDARVERALFREGAFGREPQDVREALAEVARLDPVHRGRHYAVDRVHLAGGADPSACDAIPPSPSP